MSLGKFFTCSTTLVIFSLSPSTRTFEFEFFYVIFLMKLFPAQTHLLKTKCDQSVARQSNLEMEAELLTKNVSYLNLNISRIKNGKNKL